MQPGAPSPAQPDLPPGLPPGLRLGLRVELHRLVAGAGSRRSLAARCLVGLPGGGPEEQQVLDDDGLEEAALRTDLVERALDGSPSPRRACAWLTRSGSLDLADCDAAWFSAVRTGFARHGLRLPAFAVLNRTGFVDLVSGERHQWGRIRNRPPTGAA